VSVPVCVLDASVGVKWFRNEQGSEQARELVEGHIAGSVALVVDTLFAYEVLRAASRDSEPHDAVRTGPISPRSISSRCRSAMNSCLPRPTHARRSAVRSTTHSRPGLATLLGAPLYSADARPTPRIRASG
jgi:predicted nucleic acid-binding protein